MGHPKLRYFLTADSAQVQQGKVTAVGLFDTIVSVIFPAVHGSMAVILGFESDEPQHHHLTLCLHDPKGRQMVEVQGPELALPGHIGTISKVLELRGLHFPEPGSYSLQLVLNGEVIAQQLIHVCEPPRPTLTTAEELEAFLQTPDIITSANSELRCDKCGTVFRFQVNLDPTVPREPGFLPPPPGNVFACGTCNHRVSCEGIGSNLRRLLGLHRSWLPVPLPTPTSPMTPPGPEPSSIPSDSDNKPKL
jgi:hypothetical protein